MGNDKPITQWVDPKDTSGEFKRQVSSFRDWVSREDGAKYPPEKGRYHLFVSYACPWAHRTLIVRNLKGLSSLISYSSVHWHLAEGGWRFVTKDEEGQVPGDNVIRDPLEGHENFTHLRNVYFESERDYDGRFTVPVLYDKKTKRIVSNESAEIVRMFETEFDDLVEEKYKSIVLRPKELEKDIDDTNSWTYDQINNGVYKSGFATTAEAYENNVKILFEALDRAEEHLKNQKEGPYWYGKNVSEVDVRLYPTIIRFDPVYVQHFKCNIRDVRSGYPYLHAWLKNLYWNHDAFKNTTQFEHIKWHYTRSHSQINPFGITPLGPLPNILPLETKVAAATEAKE